VNLSLYQIFIFHEERRRKVSILGFYAFVPFAFYLKIKKSKISNKQTNKQTKNYEKKIFLYLSEQKKLTVVTSSSLPMCILYKAVNQTKKKYHPKKHKILYDSI